MCGSKHCHPVAKLHPKCSSSRPLLDRKHCINVTWAEVKSCDPRKCLCLSLAAGFYWNQRVTGWIPASGFSVSAAGRRRGDTLCCPLGNIYRRSPGCILLLWSQTSGREAWQHYWPTRAASHPFPYTSEKESRRLVTSTRGLPLTINPSTHLSIDQLIQATELRFYFNIQLLSQQNKKPTTTLYHLKSTTAAAGHK